MAGNLYYDEVPDEFIDDFFEPKAEREKPSEKPEGSKRRKRGRRSRGKKTEQPAAAPQAAQQTAPPQKPVAEAAPKKAPPKKPSPPRQARKPKEPVAPPPSAKPEPADAPVAAEPKEPAAAPPAKKPKEPRQPKPKEPRPAKPKESREAKPKEPSAAKPKEPSIAKPKEPSIAKPKEQPTAAPPFGDLQLSETMRAALAQATYSDPTPVQGGVIPRALEGVDLMAQARTGTGKTAAFAIPILERIEMHKGKSLPQAIVLTPTRELAVQVKEEFVKLAAGRKVAIVALYGGKPLRQQTEHLRHGVDIIIGTPGRILDHMDRRTLQLDGIRVAVLDEADRMLDIGFRPDIEKILRRTPSSRQTLLFSATLPGPVKRLAQRYMRDPETLDFSPTDVAVETIEQFYFTIDPETKFELLVQLLRKEDPHQAIIFCRTKRGTEKVYQRLSRRFENVDAIHGDLPQRQRDKVMANFRKGTFKFLVATDVVGRGIDVSGISHIINYDIPQFADDYVHRVGRTGRMGREGVAYTLVSPEEGNELTRIEMRINRLLHRKETLEYGVVPWREKTLAPPTATGDSGQPATPVEEEPAPAAPERKPVYGRPLRRVRRAL